MKHFQSPQSPAPKAQPADQRTADPASQSRFSASDPQPHEQNFRSFIKASLPRHKAGADIIQAIKASIRRAD